MQLAVLLDQSLVELRQLSFHIVLDVLLLVAHDLEDFVLELCLTLFDELLEFGEHGLHKWRKLLKVLNRLLVALPDILLHVAQLPPENIEPLEGS